MPAATPDERTENRLLPVTAQNGMPSVAAAAPVTAEAGESLDALLYRAFGFAAFVPIRRKSAARHRRARRLAGNAHGAASRYATNCLASRAAAPRLW